MITCGNRHAWDDLFPDRLVPDIIGLVLSSWQSFEQPNANDLEVPITRRFYVHLSHEKGLKRRLPFSIHCEASEIDSSSCREIGRIDLRLIAGHREDVYFAFECKRLNVLSKNGTRRSLAGEYVDEGMMRFVSGKYGRNLDKGGMLGYVMDGKTQDAITAVSKAIGRRAQRLCMVKVGGLSVSAVRSADHRVKETRHLVQGKLFIMHHLFLGLF